MPPNILGFSSLVNAGKDEAISGDGEGIFKY
jgi:hypothetical protein